MRAENKIQGLNCNLCGSNDVQMVAQSKNRSVTGDIVRCQRCQFSFVHPQPNIATMQETYDGLYSDRERFDKIDTHKQVITRRAFNGYQRQLIELGMGQHSSFADLGGGLGYYTEAAQNLGYCATLVELDPVSAGFARDKLGITDVFCGTPEQYINQTDQRFDIVFMRHVIEHIPDPSRLVATAAGLLRPGGVLIMETPNNLSAEIMLRPVQYIHFMRYYRKHYLDIGFADIFLKQLYAIRPPNHLNSFRLENLRSLCTHHGLQPVSAFSYLTGDSTYWPNENIANYKEMFTALAHFKAEKFIMALLDTFLYPLRLFAQAKGRGSAICIYAVKTVPKLAA